MIRHWIRQFISFFTWIFSFVPKSGQMMKKLWFRDETIKPFVECKENEPSLYRKSLLLKLRNYFFTYSCSCRPTRWSWRQSGGCQCARRSLVIKVNVRSFGMYCIIIRIRPVGPALASTTPPPRLSICRGDGRLPSSQGFARPTLHWWTFFSSPMACRTIGKKFDVLSYYNPSHFPRHRTTTASMIAPSLPDHT